MSGTARGEDGYPSRPVHVLVPYPPGGAVDIVARTMGDELSKHWGQPIVIENRPGAGGTIASAVAAKAAPDGYTLILVAAGHAIVSYLYPGLPYDPLRDFTPISLVGSSPNMLLVRADSAFNSVADVIAFARAHPGALSYGHPGSGTSPHLAGELFKHMAKLDITGAEYQYVESVGRPRNPVSIRSVKSAWHVSGIGSSPNTSGADGLAVVNRARRFMGKVV